MTNGNTNHINYKPMVDRLYVSHETINAINKELAANKKIAAIKALRSEACCTLREAKYAIDRLVHGTTEGPIICPKFEILGVNIRTPDGDITVDLEGLQLTGLMSMSTMGLDTCRAVLSLHDAITKWRDEVSDVVFGIRKKE